MLIQADARHIPLRDGCVQCVVTSPPYWGLRDYGTARWIGGDNECQHNARSGDLRFSHPLSDKQASNAGSAGSAGSAGKTCHSCGAERIDAQIGLEQSPDAYCGALVAVFREVRRVLKDDGVLWLNLGDCYANGDKGGYQPSRVKAEDSLQRGNLASDFYGAANRNWNGLAPKNLVGVPWRVAFALQADGWYLRSDVIWSKPNPMPESVIDRPTKAHEYLFLLTKQERYYYDAQAIAEPVSDAMFEQIEQGYDGEGTKDYADAGVQNPSSVKARIIGNARKRADQFGGAKYNGKNEASGHRRYAGFNDRWEASQAVKHSDGSVYTGAFTRNKRTVWTIPTMPYAGAHFATMPEALVEPCILAGSRFGDLVFDPFSGSGTVLAVAERFGRRGVGTDLNAAYHELAKERTAQRGLRFTPSSDTRTP